jgi:UDP-3-O-[3-hydroxymyristoyl] glucosamine N-acyltransferase
MSASGQQTLADLARLVSGELRGDGAVTVTGVAPLAVAEAGDISWLSDTRRRSDLETTRAGAVLLPADGPATSQPAVLCASVDHALAQVMRHFAPPVAQPAVGVDAHARVAGDAEIAPDAAIGPHAIIESGARVGSGTVLHGGVYLGAGSRIGRDCVLWPNVVIREGCTLGDRVTIHPNAVIGADGFGFYLHEGRHTKVPHIGGVIIEDDVEIGACACVDRSKTGNTVIRRGVKIDNLVQVAHNAVIGAHSVLCAQVGIAGSARLGDYVVLGGHVGVRDNIVLHDGVQVAACSCVPQDVPAGSKVAGLPAIEFRRYLREHASLRKLPDAVAQLRELVRRVEDLEAAADDRPSC